MGLYVTKPVFGVCDKASFKPAPQLQRLARKMEISPLASLYMIHSTKVITKALIRLRGCTGWSAQAGLPLCYLQTPQDRLSSVEADMSFSSFFHGKAGVKLNTLTNIVSTHIY